MNNINMDMVTHCENLTTILLGDRPHMHFDDLVNHVMAETPIIQDEHILQYIYYDINVLNAMNHFIRTHNVQAISDIPSLVFRYRRIYMLVYMTNNRDRLMGLQE
jgi:hypothetical protein